MASNDQAGSNKAPESTSERRRSSVTKPLFANLAAHNRNPETAARRASFGEQKVGQPGIIGKMWNNWTKGDGGSAAK
ncbi:uncharacterized protein BDZ99DRAFT_462862 [Mytilinidion resinicola]|uniref:Uncharacterized protein n=1 Tax=Mytilinidion resinicola TaxID=574789 RepID=A0A6A6YQL1_9PEZI|nr:uncharacterized protein BDZ99DRAFT_462862 [Mytilinidion resinicola]KAF2810275.1 hypothetical protein BDZ99DRAFT_462862 [Mytilinidion resinicola]